MNSKDLYKAVGDIDEKFIEDADATKTHKTMRAVPLAPWLKWAAPIAACLVIAVAVVIPTILNRPQNVTPSDAPQITGNLPLLSLPTDQGAYGFEGYMAHDISELSNGNPWRENDVFETLPVFENTVGEDNTSALFNGGGKINEAWTRTLFDPAVELPDEYSFSFNTTEQQAKEAMDYLLTQYEDVVKMEKPKTALFGDYNIYGERNYSYYAYENIGDNALAKILGFNFDKVMFAPNDDGQLWLIDRYKWDLSQKLGDYPVISLNEAREQLLHGDYITTVFDVPPTEQTIARVELIYRTSRYDTVLMPYYRFLVELQKNWNENAVQAGLKTYGAYYIPAVRGEYLANLPEGWSGQFN
jgi:hypothetical protein